MRKAIASDRAASIADLQFRHCINCLLFKKVQEELSLKDNIKKQLLHITYSDTNLKLKVFI